MARLSPKLQESLLEKGVTGVKYLIGLQFVTRSLTFFLNVLVTRKLDPSIIGIANVQLQFLLNTILFLSREGFRRSCLRVHNEKLRDLSALSKVTNVSWLAVPFGLLISFITCTIFLFFSSREELSTYYYVTTVKLTGVATLLEILSEPFFIMIQNELLYGVRVAVEASAVFLRCFFTFVFVFYFEVCFYLHFLLQRLFRALKATENLLTSWDSSLLRWHKFAIRWLFSSDIFLISVIVSSQNEKAIR